MLLLCVKIGFMEKIELTIPEQIKIALDGRTQRWLSFKVEIPESDFSKKMNGVISFTTDELERINKRLNCNIHE